MKQIVALIFILLTINTYALDPIWNMRYTFGPDSRISPKFGLGLGMKSNFNDNLLIPMNILGSISKDFEIGAKMDIFTYNEMDNTQMNIDVGGRYRLTQSKFIEVDGYFGLNKNNGSAVIVTYAFEQFIAKSFSSFYELRAGFLDGVVSEDGYVKIASALVPTLHFGHTFKAMIELNASGSAGYLKDDFMIDIIPKLELILGSSRIRLDFDIGIMQEKNNNQKSIALYVITAL